MSRELHGELIDVVRFHDDIEAFVREALHPALIQSVTIDHDAHSVNVSIAGGQQQLALGQDGQGIRLAEELTGWNIKIEVTQQTEEVGSLAQTPAIRRGHVRDWLFILTALVIAGTATYWLIPLTGFPFSAKGLWIVTIGSALFAGILVLLGESIIEDGMKVGMMLVLTGLLWFTDGRLGFFVGCVVLAGMVGSSMNQLNRTLARSASVKGNSNGK